MLESVSDVFWTDFQQMLKNINFMRIYTHLSQILCLFRNIVKYFVEGVESYVACQKSSKMSKEFI